MGDLAGFSSAIILSLVALWLVFECVLRLANPVPISFGESLLVAVVGLAVNLLSAWLLRHDHGHVHTHEDGTTHRDHADHNIRSAYFHVLADALTSVLAIAGLTAGLLFGWIWMDAIMGIVGGAVIARWSYQLIRDTGAVLLDMTPDPGIAQKIRSILEVDGDRVADLHLWRVGPGHYSAIVSLVTHKPERPSYYRERLRVLRSLSHVTVEIDTCCD